MRIKAIARLKITAADVNQEAHDLVMAGPKQGPAKNKAAGLHWFTYHGPETSISGTKFGPGSVVAFREPLKLTDRQSFSKWKNGKLDFVFMPMHSADVVKFLSHAEHYKAGDEDQVDKQPRSTPPPVETKPQMEITPKRVDPPKPVPKKTTPSAGPSAFTNSPDIVMPSKSAHGPYKVPQPVMSKWGHMTNEEDLEDFKWYQFNSDETLMTSAGFSLRGKNIVGMKPVPKGTTKVEVFRNVNGKTYTLTLKSAEEIVGLSKYRGPKATF